MYIVAGTIPVMEEGSDRLFNDCFFFGPSGNFGVQGKMHMTRFETEEWKISARPALRITIQ
jgi:predicted amidohydrolase